MSAIVCFFSCFLKPCPEMAALIPFKKAKLRPEEVTGGLLKKMPVGANTTEDLKAFLRSRGIKITSVKKNILIDQVTQALNLRTPLQSSSCPQSLQKVVDEKRANDLSKLGEKSVFPVNGWKVFPSSEIPAKFSERDIQEFLVNAVVIDSSSEEEDIGTTKSLKRGIKYYNSRHVNNLEDQDNDTHYFVKGKVFASYDVKTSYTVLVRLDKCTGQVDDAACHCKASALQRCAHVGALLIAVNDHVKRFGRNPVPCTSRLCEWNRGGKKKDPKPFYMETYSNKWNPQRAIGFNPLRYSPESRNVKNKLLDLLVSPPFATAPCRWEQILEHDYHDYGLDDDRAVVLKELKLQFLQALLFGHYNEPGEVRGTLDQGNSPDWLRYRRLLVTASAISRVRNVTTENAYAKLRDHLWFPLKVANKYTRYGLQNEATARERYISLTGNHVQLTGMWVNPRYPGLAASPDGIAFCARTGTRGLVEIKCPYRLRNSDPCQVDPDDMKNFYLKRDATTQQLYLNPAHQYFAQMQMQMAITGALWCDFVVWSAHGIWVQRIPFDPNHWEAARQPLQRFHERFICPEYFEMRTPRRLDPFELE